MPSAQDVPRPEPPPAVPAAALVRALLRLFFRSMEVVGTENLPRDSGAVLVAWHPNGLVDPALIFAHSPRRVVFGARHGLFAWPGLGALLRSIGTVPIYRPQDSSVAGGPAGPEARRQANLASLDALAREVTRGAFAVLFPEGVSHDRPHLMELRPGAARLFLRACELTPPGQPPPVLLPVGLHYDRKHLMGSRALIELHPPLELPPDLEQPETTEEGRRRQVEALTRRIGEELTETVQATESWELHFLMHRLRKVVRAERAQRAEAQPGPASLRERVLGLARIRQAERLRRQSHPEESATLEDRVRRYDAELRALRLDDHDLDGGVELGSVRRRLWLAMQAVAVYLLLPPLLVVGAVVNLPVAAALAGVARQAAREKKDVGTIKLLLGAVVFPLVWLAVSALVAWGQINLHAAYPQIPEAPLWAGIVTFLLCSVGGWLAYRYLHLAGSTYRALATTWTRARKGPVIARLRRERGQIFEAAMELSRDLDLPGGVARARISWPWRLSRGCVRAGSKTAPIRSELRPKTTRPMPLRLSMMPPTMPTTRTSSAGFAGRPRGRNFVDDDAVGRFARRCGWRGPRQPDELLAARRDVDAARLIREGHCLGEFPLKCPERRPVLDNMCPQQRIAGAFCTMAPGDRERCFCLEQMPLDPQRIAEALPCLRLQVLEPLRATCGLGRTRLRCDAGEVDEMVHSRGILISDGVAAVDKIAHHFRMPEAAIAGHLDLLRR